MSEQTSRFSDANEMQNSLLAALEISNELTNLSISEQFLCVFRFSLEIKQLCLSALLLST